MDSMINNVRRYRESVAGMTQQDLAVLVGVTRQSIISIEQGRYRPSVELALRLARIFNVSVEDLFELTRDMRTG
jgi:putative transcriptional regulator